MKCVPTHVALRMPIMQVLASQLHFLANKNSELAIPPLFVYSLYCDLIMRFYASCHFLLISIAMRTAQKIYRKSCVSMVEVEELAKHLGFERNELSRASCKFDVLIGIRQICILYSIARFNKLVAWLAVTSRFDSSFLELHKVIRLRST